MNGPEISRRECLAALLGISAASLPGCSPQPLPPRGEMKDADIPIGHRLRDGFRPQADSYERRQAVIIGGGIAGLAAAWRLYRAGMEDVVLLEISDTAGGTARSERRGVFAYPWGAHYVTTPMKENRALVELLAEMQVIAGTDAAGEPIIAEQYLCREPEERLFVAGRWVEGLFPADIASEEDFEQLARFQETMGQWAERQDARGRRMFAIPVADGSDSEEVRALDRQTMEQWMDQEGFTSEPLRWVVDYACRDDYGMRAAETSAWAGILYFAARMRDARAEPQSVITWPEGNGRIVDHLAARVGASLRLAHAAVRVETVGRDGESRKAPVRVTAWDTRRERAVGFACEQVIFACPHFLAPHIIEGYAKERGEVAARFNYGSWLVANVHLRDRPPEASFPMAWDNVFYDSDSLGYVTATHQTGADHGPTVLTWYHPLADLEPAEARRRMLDLRWEDWTSVVVADLERAHPGIVQLIDRIDIMRWGHAMIQPRPGFVWSEARRRAAEPWGRVHFANTDLSGVALMEEALYHGVRAAEEVLAANHHSVVSLL